MKNKFQFELKNGYHRMLLKDFEFASSQYLSNELPDSWNSIVDEELYQWIESNAWYPYEEWSGERIYEAIVDLAIDLRAYIERDKNKFQLSYIRNYIKVLIMRLKRLEIIRG